MEVFVHESVRNILRNAGEGSDITEEENTVEELCDALDERVSAGPSGAPDQRPVCGDPEIRSPAGREEGISNALVSEEESGCVSNCTWQWSPVWRDLTESLWGSDGCLPWPKIPGKRGIYSNFYRRFGCECVPVQRRDHL